MPFMRQKTRLRYQLKGRFPKRFQNPQKIRLSFYGMLPNIATLTALCFGLSAVRLALSERWELAIGAIVAAAILDGMDGRLARLLNSCSRFGAELDSLADFMNFGIAPALILYTFSLKHGGAIGWLFCLYYAVCLVLRLARFNTISIEGRESEWPEAFFMGIPAPAAGLLVLLPLILHIEFMGTSIGAYFQHPALNATNAFVVATLAISRVPTLSLKRLQISPKFLPVFLIGLAFICGALFSETWLTLALVGVLYYLSILWTVRAFQRQQKRINHSYAQDVTSL